MENLHTFLARYPPFNGIDSEALRALTADA